MSATEPWLWPTLISTPHAASPPRRFSFSNHPISKQNRAAQSMYAYMKGGRGGGSNHAHHSPYTRLRVEVTQLLAIRVLLEVLAAPLAVRHGRVRIYNTALQAWHSLTAGSSPALRMFIAIRQRVLQPCVRRRGRLGQSRPVNFELYDCASNTDATVWALDYQHARLPIISVWTTLAQATSVRCARDHIVPPCPALPCPALSCTAHTAVAAA